MRKRIAALLLLALALLGCTPGANPQGWEWVNPPLAGEPLASVAYGGGRYVAVGPFGNIVTGDGETWEAAPVGPEAMLSSVTYGNGRFVAVGYDYRESPPASEFEKDPPLPPPPPQVTYISRNGKQWERVETGAPGRLDSVVFGKGRFVAIGTGGITTSTDGETWTEPVISPIGIRAFAYGDGRFVAVGRGILTSEDGTTWVKAADEAGFRRIEFVSAAYGQGKFVAASDDGQIWTATDGIHWTKQGAAPLLMRTVAYGHGRFLAIAGTQYLTSADGVTWEYAEKFLPAPINSVAAGDGILVAAGGSGAILTTADGVTWTEHTPALLTDFRGAAFGDGRYVAVGYRLRHPIGDPDHPKRPSVATSPDGVKWAPAAAPAAEDLHAVAYGNGVFVAIGRHIFTSDDGDRWEQSLNDYLGFEPSALTFGGGRFIVVTADPGRVFTSTDGKAWESAKLGERTRPRSVAWGNGRFVSVGDDGEAFTSTDGLTWSRLQMPVEDLEYVAFGQGKFVAVGRYSEVLTSTDGVQWSVLPEKAGASRLIYGDGYFVGFERYGLGVSPDGTTWTRLPRMTSRDLNAVAFAGGKYFLLGDGVIITRKQWEEE